jgi:hypothetical protein
VTATVVTAAVAILAAMQRTESTAAAEVEAIIMLLL